MPGCHEAGERIGQFLPIERLDQEAIHAGFKAGAIPIASLGRVIISGDWLTLSASLTLRCEVVAFKLPLSIQVEFSQARFYCALSNGPRRISCSKV